MADNVILPGTGSVIGADLISGTYYQRVKMTWGTDGTVYDVCDTYPAPVNILKINGLTPDMGSGASSSATLRVVVASGVTSGVNVAQVNGATVDIGSGNVSTGTQRVVLASNQPQFSTPLNFNMTHVFGTACDVNSGNKSNGTQRVIIATDQPAFTTATPSNQTQFNGVAVSVGTGTSGTGVQRVVLATDQPQLTNALLQTGDIAHAATDSGNPLKLGHKTASHGANPTAVTSGQRSNWYSNVHGVPFVIGGHPNVQNIRLNFTSAQTNIAIITASSIQKIVVTEISVSLDDASSVKPSVLIGFGTATTPTTSKVVFAHGGISAGRMYTRGDGTGIIGVGALDEDLRITTVGTATGGGVDVVVSYHIIEA